MKSKDERKSLLYLSMFSVLLIPGRALLANDPIVMNEGLMSFLRSFGYLFFVWNLLLAWIPYWLSEILEQKADATSSKGYKKELFVCIPLAGIWLLFFPNAPYILTDFVHLRPKSGVPFYYDLVLTLSFAWTGLLLGLLSLRKVHQSMNLFISEKYTWLLIIMTIVSCSFGIYLGRELRFNSWDILLNPLILAKSILKSLINPQAIGMTLVLSLFLGLSYFQLGNLIKSTEK